MRAQHDSNTNEPTSDRSQAMEASRDRRAFLASLAGAGAGAAVAVLAAPAIALAADGDPLLLGGDNHADGITALTRDSVSSTQDATFVAENTISAALVGHASSGPGIVGRSESGAGVQGFSQTDAGINGFGVFGVWAGGEAFGLFGTSEDGDGIHGRSANGAGGSFESATGNALSTSGRLHFSGVSGVATIPAGTLSKTVTPGTDVGSSTFVLLTPRGNLAGRDLWYTLDEAGDTLTIRISRPAPHGLEVGWLLID